ncbi:MAG: cell division protein FtsK [Rhodospirillaceae bacterium]|nr:cell division protein FtsK [Rhodospirillaceae bacterium]OUT77825.1 MAG: cell division protein FtsK [Rhodospirillaceae bacterium TMED23]|tara:strand:- start:810 stop:3227 length:2418 start_codon:yes stop_codon:yes gene_type:complete
MFESRSSNKRARKISQDSLVFEGPILPKSFVNHLRQYLGKSFGLGLITIGTLIILSLISYHPSDPSLNSASGGAVKNIIGIFGSYSSDLLLQLFGSIAILPSILFYAWGWRLLAGKSLGFFWLRSLVAFFTLLLASMTVSQISTPEDWSLHTGLGGVSGGVLFQQLLLLLTDLKIKDTGFYLMLVSPPICIISLIYASGLDRNDWRGVLNVVVKSNKYIFKKLNALKDKFFTSNEKQKPRLDPELDSSENIAINRNNETLEVQKSDVNNTNVMGTEKNITVVESFSNKPIRNSDTADASQGSLNLTNSATYQLPPLDFLEAPPASGLVATTDKESLKKNAGLLETVMSDFGVKGEIVKVRPGPVVTLYELEPAPGTKTSRVIGLSDDISRSMSALSVRIAVVPGRSVIGIELPNLKKDMVYFREILASSTYKKSKSQLPLVLGKDIGGSPIVVDLAAMPHLLIAGTTGSGKSVAINTMICSLLYSLNPETCKFIMVDPKMLELSVYDGIPNLLAPVVTDPTKAVIALKWAVREMEDRYRLMSQMGVRNITGYNSRLEDAKKKDEEIKRRVQTGFDDYGKPIFEDQDLSTDPLPLIIIIVDEMADLMMVAGKDIEALIQRLAQMARAAGIHLIMATQRPSVDVITGTIKANFPTRISFQVTSKIDSRTILGEQGAEQLLGQGDMLYMAGGGQITRIHGPFVSDKEVENVVKHLKNQGNPEYIDAVTEEMDEETTGITGTKSNDKDDLYDQAISIVSQEGKASTSLIQRRLQIGYNRAARIIEQMESEEVISKADRVGRREVLIGTH